MKPERLSDEQPHTENDGINLLSVYRSMLRIVARLGESEYTEDNSLLRQTEVYHHSDLADPASAEDTVQG
ncbi:MAG: hypothetical protein L6Q98_16830 [Anaerolineae bacterium]|nr:hypothetical protein [Anaerolineae bacterium]NUQ03896.1 hypothetical protein [Anaerolineae bacterium]